jgi:hypothetical protein
MRIIFAGGGTGGHLYPGLAIARALVKADRTVEPFFIGAERGIERDVLPQVGFPFELLDLHPLYRSRPWENWKTVRGAMTAWRRIAGEVQSEPPACVVGTGGYASGLALAYAVAHHIPFVMQEHREILQPFRRPDPSRLSRGATSSIPLEDDRGVRFRKPHRAAARGCFSERSCAIEVGLSASRRGRAARVWRQSGIAGDERRGREMDR